MIKKNKSLIFFLLGLVLVILPVTVWAVSDPSFGLKSAGDAAGLTGNKISTSGGVEGILGTLVGILLSFVGVFFFLLILASGFTWMTAQGSAEKVGTAKKRMISAAIGLIIVLSAYALANYVFSEFLGGSNATEGSCKNIADGVSCGDNQVCQSSKCVDECIFKYPSTGKCGTVDSCGEGSAIVSGLCPGGENNKCCVANSEYSGGAIVNTSGGNEVTSCSDKGGLCVGQDYSCPGNVLSDSDCPSQQKCCVASCSQQNGSCVSKSSCSTFGGKILSSVNCGSSEQVCCQTCNTLGGACLYGSTESCSGDRLTGYCPVDSGGSSGVCCIGNYLSN